MIPRPSCANELMREDLTADMQTSYKSKLSLMNLESLLCKPHQPLCPFQMSHHNGSTVFLSKTCYNNTPGGKDKTTGGLADSSHTACWADEHILGSLTRIHHDRSDATDTTTTPLSISLMTELCC